MLAMVQAVELCISHPFGLCELDCGVYDLEARTLTLDSTDLTRAPSATYAHATTFLRT